MNKEEKVIQAAAGYMELSKRCELREGLTSLWVGVSSFASPPTHTAKAGVVRSTRSQVASNDLNDSHRKPLKTD